MPMAMNGKQEKRRKPQRFRLYVKQKQSNAFSQATGLVYLLLGVVNLLELLLGSTSYVFP